MLFKADVGPDGAVFTASDTPDDDLLVEPASLPLLPPSMQQRVAAWDDEDRHKRQQPDRCGVWLTVDEREALELEWQRQVDEVKEALREQAECRERERERQHQQEKEAWQTIESSRREREEAEAIMHRQRRQQLEEEDRLLQRAIEEKRQRLQQLEQQLDQHDNASRTGSEAEEKYEEVESVQQPLHRQVSTSPQQQQPDRGGERNLGQAETSVGEVRSEVEELVERLAALREEEKEVRQRMQQERRQLNRDNMSLLLAIRHNRQQLQQTETPRSPLANSPAATSSTRTDQSLSPAAACQTTTPQPPASPLHDSELRALRQQLTDERRRVEALQHSKHSLQQDNHALHTRLRRLKDDIRQQATDHRVALTRAQQHHDAQLTELQQRNAQLAHALQRAQEQKEEVEEELSALQAERTALPRIEQHRRQLAGKEQTERLGKENVRVMRNAVVEKRVESDEEDGLEGLVLGLKGLQQTQATLHLHLKRPPRSSSPARPTTSARSHALRSSQPVVSKSPRVSPVHQIRRLVVPPSPTLSTVSSIEGDADMSCCHADQPSPSLGGVCRQVSNTAVGNTMRDLKRSMR